MSNLVENDGSPYEAKGAKPFLVEGSDTELMRWIPSPAVASSRGATSVLRAQDADKPAYDQSFIDWVSCQDLSSTV